MAEHDVQSRTAALLRIGSTAGRVPAPPEVRESGDRLPPTSGDGGTTSDAVGPDQELVVHLFAFPDQDGPLRAVWRSCAATLGTTHPVPGQPFAADLPADLGSLPQDKVVAAAQSAEPAVRHQVIARRLGSVVNVSVALMQPQAGARGTAPRPAAAPDGWRELARQWDRARAGVGDLLGEDRIYVATIREEPALGAGDPTGLGESLVPYLPASGASTPGWAARGATIARAAVWDVGLPGGTGSLRELAVVGTSAHAAELSALTWSDGSGRLPPLAAYLLITAKVGFLTRLLDGWRAQGRHVVEAFQLGVPPAAGRADDEARRHALGNWAARLGEWEATIRLCRSELQDLLVTGDLSRYELGEWLTATGVDVVPGDAARDSIFARAAAAARSLCSRVDDEILYLGFDLQRIAAARRTAKQLTLRPPAPVAQPPADPVAQGEGHVFVVYAHENDDHRQAVRDLVNFLRERCGIDAEYDRFYEGERRDWPSWARHRITTAGHVIVVASPICRRALEHDFPVNVNQGIYDELSLLQDLRLQDRGTWDRRILPVIMPPYGVDHIPLFLRPRAMDHYRVPELTEAAAQDLLDALRGIIRHPRPPLRRS